MQGRNWCEPPQRDLHRRYQQNSSETGETELNARSALPSNFSLLPHFFCSAGSSDNLEAIERKRWYEVRPRVWTSSLRSQCCTMKQASEGASQSSSMGIQKLGSHLYAFHRLRLGMLFLLIPSDNGWSTRSMLWGMYDNFDVGDSSCLPHCAMCLGMNCLSRLIWEPDVSQG